MVNCGAYTGDTIKQLNQKVGKVKSIACFEPDKNNYSNLINYLHANKENIAEYIITFPCGVYSKNEIRYFSEGDNTNSRISENGNTAIQVIKLDDALLNYKPTLIQMDIEGSELEALHGAEKIIKENYPDLAICVYHSPEHIWEIPLFIKSLNKNYQLYLRNYTGYISETVLYAVKGD
ncbi:FkbM family methyltransferase [Marinitoga lauensis]|uniref:FkbM family methyltransferase n=1 Tax=Marinitoga lauensis TaxID=2201189 RepID=UPI001404B081|nr:FkbM family methyltransferase [Marinitoga lauensis]